MVDHPLLARRELGRAGDQGGADAFAGGQAQQHVVLAAPGDDGAGATACRTLRCQHLGQHAAAADAAAGTAGHRFQRRVAGSGFVDESCSRVLARVGCVQAALVGQDHVRVGVNEVRDERAERVVVAEADLVVDDGVVLVDHRDDLQRQQRQQRAARVQVALAVGQVGVRQQHLRAVHAVLGQPRLVHLHEPHLADSGGGLQLVHFLRPRGPAQALHAFGDRAAGHHQQFAPLPCEHRQLARPIADGHGVDAAAFVGDEAGAHLDDDAARALQHASHRQARWSQQRPRARQSAHRRSAGRAAARRAAVRRHARGSSRPAAAALRVPAPKC